MARSRTKRVHELRLLDRTDLNAYGKWATITTLTSCPDGKIVVTTTGWVAPGDPFIDSVTCHPDDYIEWAPPDFLWTLVDNYGHLFPCDEETAA